MAQCNIVLNIKLSQVLLVVSEFVNLLGIYNVTFSRITTLAQL